MKTIEIHSAPVSNNPVSVQPKATRILYWTLVLLFAVLMLLDGVAGVMQVEGGQEAMRQLGYPLYILTILGVAKILGSMALIQPKYRLLKEWAFAGFAFNFLGAAASWALAGKGIEFVAPALIMLAVLFGIYFLGKKVTR